MLSSSCFFSLFFLLLCHIAIWSHLLNWVFSLYAKKKKDCYPVTRCNALRDYKSHAFLSNVQFLGSKWCVFMSESVWVRSSLWGIRFCCYHLQHSFILPSFCIAVVILSVHLGVFCFAVAVGRLTRSDPPSEESLTLAPEGVECLLTWVAHLPQLYWHPFLCVLPWALLSKVKKGGLPMSAHYEIMSLPLLSLLTSTADTLYCFCLI